MHPASVNCITVDGHTQPRAPCRGISVKTSLWPMQLGATRQVAVVAAVILAVFAVRAAHATLSMARPTARQPYREFLPRRMRFLARPLPRFAVCVANECLWGMDI
jgi:hypothetical protein